MIKDKTAKNIIKGASAGLALFLTWLIYRKDNRTPDQKRKDDEEWKSGGRKRCLTKIAKIILLCLLFGLIMELAGGCSTDRTHQKRQPKNIRNDKYILLPWT